ncbi:MAG: heavy metal translocating P-type ATPase, partial [Gammaproteobacteria bacterium]
QALIHKIQKLGYGAEEDLAVLEQIKLKDYKRLKSDFLISAALTLMLFYFAFFQIEPLKINQYAMFVLASVVQFYAGGRFYALSYKAISNYNYDMNVLVALGTSAAYFYSVAVILFADSFPLHLRFLYFDGAAVIITFILLGRLLEERSKSKATDFLKKLMNLAPLNATLINPDGSYSIVLASDLQIGNRVLIKQGEKISTDALIIKGSADVDASMLTGESMPVYKTIGDAVVAGTLNIAGVIEVEVLKRSNDTTLSKIVQLLSTAQSKKMPISRFADKVANIFVPIVVGISIITFLVWHFLVGDTLGAIIASISVLIISCPCALGLATPIAIVSSVGKGAKEGILIKNPEILEIIKDIKYAVFDKTGTLTAGVISVKDSLYEEQHLNLLGSIEKMSEHPISKAVVTYAISKNLHLDAEFDELELIPGRGISAQWQGKTVRIGSLAFLEEFKIQVDKQYSDFYTQTLAQGSGVILASIGQLCVGVFALEDAIKEGAIELIADLKRKNITPILLTGDNQVTANNVAKQLNIDQVFAQVLPGEKYKIITELQNEAKVMFVGDGVNDSPSIKQADIGITLNSGSDITKDAGDIILINNDLKSVSKSINLSVESMKIIKQNLFWAFIYNAAGIPLAAGVLYPIIGLMLTPAYAGIAMSFSSVTVVLNSLRLKYKLI